MKYKHDKNSWYPNETPSWIEKLLVKLFRVRLIPQACKGCDGSGIDFNWTVSIHGNPVKSHPNCISCNGTGKLLYLRRVYLSPRWKWLGRYIFLHHILLSDGDNALHDHPAPFITRLIKGSYKETSVSSIGNFIYTARYKAGKTLRNPATHTHRLDIDKPVWTLVIWGKPYRIWGFYPATEPFPNGIGWTTDNTLGEFVPWYEFLGLNPESQYPEDQVISSS